MVLDNNETTERQQRIAEATFKNKTDVAFRVDLSSRRGMYICKLNRIVVGGKKKMEGKARETPM